MSVSFIKKLRHRQRQTGSLAPKPASGGPARTISPAAQTWLVAYVGQHADATLAELNTAWQAEFGRPVGQTSIWNVLHEHGLRRKKSNHATERDTERVRAARASYVETVCTRPDAERFHFLDETGLRLDYCRQYARATGGQRVGQAVPLTLIGALSVRGLGAVQLLEGGLN